MILVAGAWFAGLAERLGLEFIGLGTAEEYREALRDPDIWHPWRAFQVAARGLIIPLTRPCSEIIEAPARAGDLVVAAPATAFGARIAQEKLGVPLATVHLQPVLIRSVHEPPMCGYPDILAHLPQVAVHFTDLVEKQRAALRALEPAHVLRHGAGEGALGQATGLPEQDWLHMLAQAAEPWGIVSKEIVSPNRVGSRAAVLRHRFADGLIGPEIRPSEVFGLAPNPDDEDSIVQFVGNHGLCLVQPIFPVIKIDQQDHSSLRKAIHLADMVRLEAPKDFRPSAGHREHLHSPRASNLQEKTVGQLAVGIVLRQHQDVRPILIHGSRSPRTSALIRSPLTCNSFSGRTIVGSSWLLR